MTEKKCDLRSIIAAYFHSQWRENIEILIRGGHLSDVKRHQYVTGLCRFEDLEPYHQNGYYTMADELLALVGCHLDEFMEFTFLDES